MKPNVSIERTKLADIEQMLPELLQAKEQVTSELRRVVQDPMTGQVNKSKVLTSKEAIEARHQAETDDYKQSALKLKKKREFNA